MKSRYLLVVFAGAVGTATVALLMPASPALGGDDAHGFDVADAAAAEATAHAAYQAHLAANNAAAERWKSTHRNTTPNRSTDDELVATNHGCPEGTQFWQRDRLTELCATPCTRDLDCAPEEGRCRVIDVFDESKVPAAPLVDDTAPEEIEALLSDETRPEPPLLLCDPFYDLVDLPDLELFEVEGAAAE
ncbi:MAG: hypothetical protein IT383_00250 [Deltaproteobacteria bacterium]|nr:hypothetical protein [Deltaproteobacteria bacterium]